MVQTGQITFYTHTRSVYCHRVHIALEEANADYTSYSVNLKERPAWYAKVNPAGKIPAITYGGPNAPPDDPAPEAVKINESLVILEFLADLFPEAKLLPSDPVLRAQARLFMLTVDKQLFEGFRQFLFNYTEGAEKALLDGFEALQARLPVTGFAIGEWSIADAAAAPFLVRIELLLKHDLGTFPEGEGLRVLQLLQEPKFARVMQYLEDCKSRPSVKSTWDEVSQVEIWKENSALKRR
ncbi:thioredoxin-like protein [Trametes cingulata]|nr:thioredoxin-like protein [Trametes cingulata]